MWPVLTALKELGGSGAVKEIYENVVEDRAFTEEQQALSAKDGRMSCRRVGRRLCRHDGGAHVAAGPPAPNREEDS